MQRQQQQPDLSMVVMHSQDASIMSHLQMPMVRLQVQTAMPFIIMQQVTMPPAIMVQRFCIMVQAALSSHVQVIFIPPVHFSIFMVQRGIMSHCEPVGMGVMLLPVIAGMLIPVRSIIMLVMAQTPFAKSVTLSKVFLPNIIEKSPQFMQVLCCENSTKANYFVKLTKVVKLVLNCAKNSKFVGF